MIPAVSIIIPAYNREASIALAVESVLRQSWTDFELIIVDDCSTDGTRAVAEGLGDPRIRVAQTPENCGASGARNFGASLARADWVAFQDSDDEWLPEKLRKQMDRLEQMADADACYCGMVIVGEADDPDDARPEVSYLPDRSIQTTEGDIHDILFFYSLISTQTLIVRRTLFERLGGFDESLLSLVDWELSIRMSEGRRIAFVDEPLVVQNFSDNSLTRDQEKRLQSRRQVTRKHHEAFTRRPAAFVKQYRSIAGAARRLGRLDIAADALKQARRRRPFDPQLLAASVLVALKRFRP